MVRYADDFVILCRTTGCSAAGFGYFKQARSSTFIVLDKLIRRRLRALLRKQEKRPAVGRSLEDQQRWPNRFFAEQGLFSLVTAHRLACQSLQR